MISPSPFVETERLILRDLTWADAENLFILDSDPEVMRFLSGGKPTPREHIESNVLPGFLSPRGGLDRWIWAAIERQSGAFAGWLSLRPPDDAAGIEAELGFRLRRQFWNRGYATEGARALVDKGFSDLGLQRIFARTMAVNHASRRVMEKAGLRYVRTFHLAWDEPIAGSELGEVEYAVMRSESVGGAPAPEGRSK